MSARVAQHPLESGDPPAWACAWGQDPYGVWASFAVGQGDDPVEQSMRWIVPGDFLMGSPTHEEGRWDGEGPQHRVRITNGFWLADTPCTQGLWTAVMGENPSRFQEHENSRDRPVEQVSFHHVVTFMERLAALVPALNPRLPTEAEWEYACRAGHEALPTYPLPGQSTPAPTEAIAWYHENSGDSTQPVALKPANRWGLHDMLGNMDEWCSDAPRSYTSDDELLVDPRTHDDQRADRVVRGGSWYDGARGVRAAYRYWYPPVYAGGNLGFRLARGQDQ